MLLLHTRDSILSQIAKHGSFFSPRMYCAYPEEHLISRMTDPNPVRYDYAHMRTRVLNHSMHHYLHLSEGWLGLVRADYCGECCGPRSRPSATQLLSSGYLSLGRW